MAIIEVHRQPLYRRHYASVCSETGVFCVLQGFLLVFLPLIIAFNSGGGAHFWTTSLYSYAQPRVQYTYTSITEFQGMDTTTALPFTVASTSSPFLASLYPSTRQAVLEAASADTNRDGITDSFDFKVTLPLRSSEIVTGFSVTLFFTVQLTDQVSYIFDALALASFQSGSALREVVVDGDFVVRQSDALLSKGGMRAPYEASPLLPTFSKGVSPADVTLTAILDNYSSRNLSMVLDAKSVTPKYASRKPLLDTTATSFTASLRVRVPIQPVRYTPPVSEVLKDAWIQYVSFFLVVWFLIFRLNSFLYSHKLVRSYTVADLVIDKSE